MSLIVPADHLHLGDLILLDPVLENLPTTTVRVEKLELHGDDVVVNGGTVTTSVSNPVAIAWRHEARKPRPIDR